jgi:hypothetical protein
MMTTLTPRRVCARGVALAVYLGWVAGAIGGQAPIVRVPTATPVGPEYDPLGIPLGGFLLFPSLRATTTFDDNIRRTEDNTLSDTIFTFSPIVALRSDWAVHALNFTASSSTSLYTKYTSENVTTYDFVGDGRIDVRNDLRLSAQAGYGQLYLVRSSVELPSDAVKPLPYTVMSADVSMDYQPSQLRVQVGIGYERYRYGSVGLLSGGEVSWDDQNRDIISPHARVSYQFQENYAAYVETIFSKHDYELPLDRYGVDRSSKGYSLRGGISTLLGALIQGEAFVGYLRQNYSEPLEDVTGFDFGAIVDWPVTPLTTLRLRASRVVTDTTFQGVSGLDDKSVAFSVDHELLRNLVLRGNVGYLHSTFQGVAREDELFDAGVGAEYFLNRYLSLAGGYAFQKRTSNSGLQTYSVNLFSIAVRGHL